MISTFSKLINFLKENFRWIIIGASSYSLLSTYGNVSQWTTVDYIEVLVAVVSLIGVNAFFKNYKIISISKFKLSPKQTLKFWGVSFWVRLITLFPYFFYILTPKDKLSTLPPIVVSTAILSASDSFFVLIPALLSVFYLSRLTYGKNPWKSIQAQAESLISDLTSPPTK